MLNPYWLPSRLSDCDTPIRAAYRDSRFAMYNWHVTVPRSTAKGDEAVSIALSTNGRMAQVDVAIFFGTEIVNIAITFCARHYDDARRAVYTALQFDIERVVHILLTELPFQYNVSGGYKV